VLPVDLAANAESLAYGVLRATGIEEFRACPRNASGGQMTL